MLRLAVAVLFCVSLSSATRPINGTQCHKNQAITRITVFDDGTLEAECGPIPCGEVGRRCIQDQASCRADTDVFSGMRWAPNGQRYHAITRITVFDDGTLEAECGPIPCGEVGRRCIQDQASCRADTDVFSGMRWAPNGQRYHVEGALADSEESTVNHFSVLLRCCTIKVPNKIYVGTDLVTAGSYYEGGVVAKKDMYYPKGREYDFIANVRTEQGGVRVWVYRIACGENDRRVEFEPIVVGQQRQPLPQPSIEKPAVSVVLVIALTDQNFRCTFQFSYHYF
ncbi:hypothetical protein COOONC_14172 [Cooperia oncophora]